MRSILRYRRIPYLFIQQNSPQASKLPKAKVPLLPTFYLPNETGEIVPVTDSTPLIRRFEGALTPLEKNCCTISRARFGIPSFLTRGRTATL